ncbi:MAG TPA: hypothetical protein PKL14_02435 [Holophaga sp.]|jgi:hypothetical protein|nr:hypothetical protein [Holophaga sp.]
MSQSGSALVVRHAFLAALALALIPLTASWPGLQWLFHAILVVALVPEFRSPLIAMLWAAAAGWAVEGVLRFYAHTGGTPLADMTLCLLVRWTLIHWPPQERHAFWGRMLVFAVLHFLLVHATVRLAAGPHAWGYGLFWTLPTIPLWGDLAFRIHRPFRS